MYATRDYRLTRGHEINIAMTLSEFRETVEWLEMVDPGDGATKDWRAELDRVDPPESADE